MPLQATSGAASYDAFGGGVAAVPKYIEEYFSTFLYKGTDATQTITNNIDLSTKGGLVWIKDRTSAANHYLFDTERGATSRIFSNLTNAASTSSSTAYFQSFNNNGFTVGYANSDAASNYASWSWAKAPKFFDVVTWSGKGISVAHSLGATPATIIVKRTNAVDNWYVVHRSVNGFFSLNTTDAASGTQNAGIGTDTNTAWVAATSTTCNFENFGNAAGTYVAYLFAHNAGGFGLTGTDNVISCGSFTTDGSGAFTVTLGYEPQWVMYKRSDSTGDWLMFDNMRGIPVGGNDAILRANTSGEETQTFDAINPTATGFYESTGSLGANRTFIYIAIRRGPMKVPTSGTSVFTPVLRTTGNPNFVAGFPIDMSIYAYRPGATGTPLTISRLTNKILVTNETSAEVANDPSLNYDQQLGYGSGQSTNSNVLSWMWKRAPSTFDVVCYTGTGSARTVTHNLTVAPELMIVKQRDIGGYWMVYPVQLGNKYLVLQLTDAVANGFTGLWNNTAPTSSVFSLGTGSDCNQSGGTYVAYLFATNPGVTKVGTYTGNGSSQTINCGFTSGARFVMIKATSTTGNWLVADSARGIVSGNDPALYLNSTAAEVTGFDWIDADSTGFVVNETATIAANTNGVQYIFLSYA